MTTKEAVEQLCEALRTDPEYYESWKANIAMSIWDTIPNLQGSSSIDIAGINAEGAKYLNRCTGEDMHRWINEGADRFLQLLISKLNQDEQDN
jgi:hypothetical protein